MRKKEAITTLVHEPVDPAGICSKKTQSGQGHSVHRLLVRPERGLSDGPRGPGGTEKRLSGQQIYSVDTLSASLGEGLLVTYAARLRERGRSIEAVYDWL
jgi:hypothetical protein